MTTSHHGDDDINSTLNRSGGWFKWAFGILIGCIVSVFLEQVFEGILPNIPKLVFGEPPPVILSRPPPPTPDPCAEAEGDFEYSDGLLDPIARLEALNRHMMRFSMCPSAKKAGHRLSELQKFDYTKNDSSNDATPKKDGLVRNTGKQLNSTSKNQIGSVSTPIKNIYLDRDIQINSKKLYTLNLRPGFTTSFVVRGDPIYLYKNGKLDGKYCDGQRLPIFKGKSTFEVSNYGGSSTLDFLEIKEGIHVRTMIVLMSNCQKL